MRKTPVTSKLCVKCNRVLPLGDFYPHKEWAMQKYRDAWCKECAIQYCRDEETLKQYCYENNREWKDSFWGSAMKKAQYILAGDAKYINPKTSPDKKRELEVKTAARQFFSMMNLSQFYGYVENVGQDGEYVADIQPDEEMEQRERQLKRTYNPKWGGSFTEDEIKYLEDAYSQYEEDFVLDNVNTRDYARKVAKASLNADIAEDKMRRGIISAGAYKEAQKIFDDLSKSANFAACRRKPGESSGFGSLGEIIMRLEVSGVLNENGFTFPEDDVDRITNDFRHTITAAGLDGQL